MSTALAIAINASSVVDTASYIATHHQNIVYLVVYIPLTLLVATVLLLGQQFFVPNWQI